MVKHAMIFAAGFGKRMQPLTNDCPKPLLKINGKSMLERIFDDLIIAGIARIVVNGHYLADKVKDFIEEYSSKTNIEIIFAFEPEILETGGGIINALDFFEGKDFIVVNGDNLFYHNTKPNIYSKMISTWDPEKMNSLFLLHETNKADGYRGNGDFDLSPSGQIILSEDKCKKYVFAGVHITKPQHFLGLEKQRRSVMDIYRKMNFEKFYGLINNSSWFHVGDPESLLEAENKLKEISKANL